MILKGSDSITEITNCGQVLFQTHHVGLNTGFIIFLFEPATKI